MAALLTPAYSGPSDGQGVPLGKVGLIAFLLPVRQMHLDVCLWLYAQPQVSQLCQAPGKDEDRIVAGVKEFSNPHYPITSRLCMHKEKITCLPAPGVFSKGCYLHHQSLSESFVSNFSEGQESAKQEHISNPAGKHQNTASNRNAETVVGDIPGLKTHPSQPLPYRPRLPTPPKPPASVATPAENRTLGAEAPQATQHPASHLPCQKSKPTRDRDKQIKSSSSERKRQEELAPENLASATRNGRYEQHVHAQPDTKFPYAQAPGIASKEFQPTKQRPPSNTKPTGTGRPTGEAGKRKRDDERPPPRKAAPAPNRDANDGQQEPVEHSDDDGESGSEREGPNGNSPRGPRANKPAERLPYRCPMHAANPSGEDRRKCKEWHNSSIAAVTRHALTDAGKGSSQWNQIKALSSVKLAAKDRWKQYYLIFNKGREDAEMERPYWGGTNPDETIEWFLRSAMAGFAPGSSTAASFELVGGYQGLLARKEQRDNATIARADAARARATDTEQTELLQSQREFDAEFARLVARMDHLSRVPGSHPPDITPTPTMPADSQDLPDLQCPAWPMPMQRTTSGQTWMNAALGTPFGEPAANTDALMVPGQSPFNPGIGGQNEFVPESQRLTDFISDVGTVVDANTDPTTRRQVQSRQNDHYRQSQMLRPPQRRYRSSTSAPGSSRRNAMELTSSSNSTLFTPLSDSATTNSLQQPRYNAPANGMDNIDDVYMGYNETDALAYQYGGNQTYKHWQRNN
ncbi:hypothetical protein PV04_06164 [Phialophora macrospora]|uniref:Uncharacterized protein n=1 Tax=Phialophora macrospora TaxID=1851006 RepID=A0A0D2G471_9EURO|nr:hypothetical protein PV04_06164 [Phialophora macrospora]